MGTYTVQKNQPMFIDLLEDIVDQGWTVSEGIAYHNGCNNGFIDRLVNLSSATEWTFRFNILSMTSGSINIVVNGESGISHTTVGLKEETFDVTGDNTTVRFYSNGTNSLSFIQVFPTNEGYNGISLMFHEKSNLFIQYSSLQPDFMLKYLSRFFAFKGGQLWEQNTNPIMNNFFGVQYESVIMFYVTGDDAEMIKTFYGIEINSNEVWTMANDGDVKIFPNKRKPNGMKSRLKKGRFANIQGKWYADFLRNTLDPRFNTELDALFNGAVLQGPIMEITMTNNSTTEVRLISVDVFYAKQNYTK